MNQHDHSEVPCRRSRLGRLFGAVVGAAIVSVSFAGTASVADASVEQVTPVATIMQASARINPIVFGELVEFSVHVTTIDGDPVPGLNVLVSGFSAQPHILTVNENGAAAVNFGLVFPGTRTITAALVGNEQFITSSDSFDMVVLPAPPTTTSPPTSVPAAAETITTITSRVSPALFGESVNVDLSLTTADGTPVPGAILRLTIARDTFLVTLDENGRAVNEFQGLTVGEHAVTATFEGDQTLAPSTDAVVLQVNARSTRTTITSRVNPSVAGQSATFDVAVVADGASAVDGRVAINVDGERFDLTLNGFGAQFFSIDDLTVGTHAVSVAFIPNDRFPGSGDSIEHVVSAAAPPTTTTSPTMNPPVTTPPTTSAPPVTSPPTTSAPPVTSSPVVTTAPPSGVAATSTGVSASPNPSQVGQAVTFTATVTPNSARSGPSGFRRPSQVDFGTVTFTDGASVLAVVQVGSDGRATFTASSLSPGAHVIAAAFGGSATSAPSSGSFTQQVGAPSATTTTVPGVLPSTGASSTPAVATAFGLVAAGSALALAGRGRRLRRL